ncbi:MAG TPA: acyl-CoA dehydrogenase family protein [Dehalococcoidia bacterium]|nr:acyl-CoA dehydrogenase family protein [Dehalococcoidia bacterium]
MLIPTLKQRAAQTEDLRQIPAETIGDLADAGLLRVANPKRFGGYEYDVDLLSEVTMELGRGCGSTAWCYSVWLVHNWMVGHWPERLQEEYFAAGPDTLASSGFAPSGKLEPEAGGFRLTGRWDFSSGSDAGTWALLGANGPDGPVFAMLPRTDYEVIDTWFVAGLKGTGSKDIQVTDAYVPAYRVVSLRDLAVPPRDGSSGGWQLTPRTPAWDLHGRPSYRLPMMNIVSFAVSMPVVGMALGAVDAFAESMRGKTGAGSAAVQMRLAEASAEADSARVISLHNLSELLARGAKGDILSEKDQVRHQRNRIYAARLCIQAITRLFEVGGAHSVYASMAMQRFFRDANVASQHTSLNWDRVREQYGRLALLS